jgi:hypothetical protein
VNAKARKIAWWTLGMALVGAFLGAKGSTADKWYKTFFEEPTLIIGGACIGLILGWLFSLRLPSSK